MYRVSAVFVLALFAVGCSASATKDAGADKDGGVQPGPNQVVFQVKPGMD